MIVWVSLGSSQLLSFQSFGDADISGEELHDILKEIDTNMNGQVELDEYLQVSDGGDSLWSFQGFGFSWKLILMIKSETNLLSNAVCNQIIEENWELDPIVAIANDWRTGAKTLIKAWGFLKKIPFGSVDTSANIYFEQNKNFTKA